LVWGPGGALTPAACRRAAAADAGGAEGQVRMQAT